MGLLLIFVIFSETYRYIQDSRFIIDEHYFSLQWPVFNATSGTHTVAIVSEAEYNACTKVSSVFEVQPCCPFGYTPESTGTNYIICTVSNHCEQGQKFSFTVESPAGSPTESPSSSASSLTVGALYAVLTTTVISFLTFF